MQKVKIQYIKYFMFMVNVVALLFVSGFICFSTSYICDNYDAREFLDTVHKLPSNPYRFFAETVLLLLTLGVSLYVRERLYAGDVKTDYALLIFDSVISLIIIYLLDFNYNGIILWVFANFISRIKEGKGRYLIIIVALLIFIGTDYELISISHSEYSVVNYINYYDLRVQRYLLGGYNLLISINLISFIVYCVYTIQEQRGLYRQLSVANEELQNANIELQKYADIKEEMGKTKERNRLAREIHDTLGHTLTGISAAIDACITTIDIAPDTTKKQLEVISKVARAGIKDVRRSVNELRPDALERLSLESAIRNMIEETNSVTNATVYFRCSVMNLRFGEDEENAIYRVIQESITNSIRHGNASQIWIEISQKNLNIRISIRDNGTGCKEMKKGFGTRHIEERVEMLNGTVSFDGTNGFKTEVTLPIRWGEIYD